MQIQYLIWGGESIQIGPEGSNSVSQREGAEILRLLCVIHGAACVTDIGHGLAPHVMNR